MGKKSQSQEESDLAARSRWIWERNLRRNLNLDLGKKSQEKSESRSGEVSGVQV